MLQALVFSEVLFMPIDAIDAIDLIHFIWW